jgi:hypothetical protein
MICLADMKPARSISTAANLILAWRWRAKQPPEDIVDSSFKGGRRHIRLRRTS